MLHVHMTLRVPAEMAAALRRLAAENERSLSAEGRRALRHHLAEETEVATPAAAT